MRRTARFIGLGSASIAFSLLCGCSWQDIFPPSVPTLPNAVAVDRALRLCSLSEADQPFHLVLDISPPPHAAGHAQVEDMRAQVELFWLNAITYRTVIRSRDFSQTRIVNGSVVEEHDSGDFYPRWIQNFVDTLLNPVPSAPILRKISGAIPVGVQAHACISTEASGAPDDSPKPQLCFEDAEPRIASAVNFDRTVWFDDYAPFGTQQIPRTLVNNLPASLLVHGQVTLLEPLSRSDYPLVKAQQFTQPTEQIATALVPRSSAESMLEFLPATAATIAPVKYAPGSAQQVSATSFGQGAHPATVYVRTDRSGKVREAYSDSAEHDRAQDDATIARALALQFKPLLINGVPQQMETTLALPLRITIDPQSRP